MPVQSGITSAHVTLVLSALFGKRLTFALCAAHIGVSQPEQPVTTAADSKNKENSGTTPKLPMYHHSSTKSKLQKAAQAPGQSKIAFMVQKRCG